ncbi:MAG: B12-binding domain-containing radical SAM protein [Candidatus Omnitrophica bacterium]|nr:B12-binding domain-containing radical SAM protein [Candidatus Omnitrophota bacterium]
MVKTLLINPPVTTYGSDSPASIYIPIGLAYLAAYLRQNNYEVKILDALAEGEVQRGDGFIRRGMTLQQIIEYIDAYKPDIIGISCMYTAYARDAHEIAEAVKNLNYKILVIFGGAHSSINYSIVMKDKNVDIVVRREGEKTLLELINAIAKGRNWKEVRGITFHNNGAVKTNPEQEYINDIDTIPFPARDLLPRNIYNTLRSPYWMRPPLDVIVSSRGCPKRCIYCSIHSVWGNKWRARSAKNVVDEMELLVKEGIKEVHFTDDNISVDKRRMYEICDEIINRRLDIKWTMPNGIALWTLDKELLIKMKRAGCYRLTFGVETGNQKMQRYIGKNLDLRYARKVIRWANDLGFWTISTHIIGFPYETKKEMKDTFNFALKSGTDFALFYALTPFLGTAVFEEFKKEGLLPTELENIDEYREFFISEFACDTKLFKKEEIIKIQTGMYKKFIIYRFIQMIFNPFKIMKKIKNIEDLHYTVKMFMNFINININLLKAKHMGAKVLYGRKK